MICIDLYNNLDNNSKAITFWRFKQCATKIVFFSCTYQQQSYISEYEWHYQLVLATETYGHVNSLKNSGCKNWFSRQIKTLK